MTLAATLYGCWRSKLEGSSHSLKTGDAGDRSLLPPCALVFSIFSASLPLEMIRRRPLTSGATQVCPDAEMRRPTGTAIYNHIYGSARVVVEERRPYRIPSAAGETRPSRTRDILIQGIGVEGVGLSLMQAKLC